MTAETREVEIVSLGAQGDGIADTDRYPLYVPFALPGERWRIGGDESNVLLSAHPDRATPICRHFGTCGGCATQHMPDDMYVAWKREMVVQAFMHRGITAPVGHLVRVPRASRRRVTMYARRDLGTLYLGYHRAGSHEMVDIAECPIASPAIEAALPALREMLEPVVSGRAEAAVTILSVPAGLDVGLAIANGGVSSRHYPRLAALAARLGFARLTVGSETLMQTARPLLTFDGVEAAPPPSAFTQAVAEAESEMIRLVTTAVGAAKRVADLFCGIGTFTLPVARRARVLAVDHAAESVSALADAVKSARGLKPVETRVRDLFRIPLSAKELSDFDAVVLDPARSGAEAQSRQLANSRMGTVVYVSCNPGTLARDARILVDGGYELESVTPIDQFLYARHVEAVAVLTCRSQRRQTGGS